VSGRPGRTDHGGSAAAAHQNAVVVGGASSAGQAALFPARHAGQVHVLIRRDDLRDTMSTYLAQRLTHHERVRSHPRRLVTSVPGVFAVGDVRAGSVKRVAPAVGEGSVVISAVHSYLAGTKTS
jgi:thioredoxin reductase